MIGFHHGRKIPGQQQIAFAPIFFEGFGDEIKKLRTDDTTFTPNTGDGAEWQTPVVVC